MKSAKSLQSVRIYNLHESRIKGLIEIQNDNTIFRQSEENKSQMGEAGEKTCSL